MSRLLIHSSAASKRSQHGYISRVSVQHTYRKRYGLNCFDLLAHPTTLETLDHVTIRSCRHLHAVGLPQRGHDDANQTHQNCSKHTNSLDLKKDHNSICKDRDQLGSRIWQSLSNTRLPRAFFVDLKRLRRFPYIGVGTPDTSQNLADNDPFDSTASSKPKDEELSTDFDDARSTKHIGEQKHDMLSGDLGELYALTTTSDFRREIRSSSLSSSTEVMPSSQSWEPVHRHGKLDLSSGEPLHREYKLPNDLPLNLPDRRTFRDDQGDRRTTKLFMQHIYDSLSTNSELSDERLTTFINDSRLSPISQDVDKCAELLTWSWILLAGPSRAVKRLLAFARHQRDASSSSVPLWVVLQILRAEQIDAESLHLLLSHIAQQQQAWVLWHGSASMLLVVRLLRHARLAAPSCYERITNLFLELLQLRFMSEGLSSDPQRAAHWCNRVLSLVAIPTSTNPYRSIPLQQASQLEVLRFMQESKPEIPVTREGYRALAKVQLMHAKTKPEMEWAQAKSLTWPPFQNQHQMGISSNHEYTGKRSRVMKVLHRMAETGYCPHGFDMATQILAGWDVDNTPTIQTRTSAYSIMRPKLWEPGSNHCESISSPQIWAARVQGTRTVREAWMCFCAYHSETRDRTQSPLVYHAMFRKLLANSVAYSERGSVPGDGRETFPDSDLQREVVFISENIPSVSELYSRMTSRGIWPFGRLLADLLQQAPTLEQGLQYIRDARMAEHTKHVLIEPGKHSDNEISQAIGTVPIRFLRSYISLLTRSPTKTLKQWHRLGRVGKFTTNGIGQRYTAVQTAKSLLVTANTKHISVWNAYFTGLEQHLHRESYYGVRTLDVQDVWAQVVDALSHVSSITQCDFRTFEPVAKVALQFQATYQSRSYAGVSPVSLVKQIFIQASTNLSIREIQPRLPQGQWHRFCRSSVQNRILKSVPTGDDIESMVWILASQNSQEQITSILDLLYWLSENHSQIAAAGFHISKHNMCAFRIFLEGSWAELLMLTQKDLASIPHASPEQLQDAQQQAKVFGWPDDDTVSRYVRSGTKYKILNRLHSKFIANSNIHA